MSDPVETPIAEYPLLGRLRSLPIMLLTSARQGLFSQLLRRSRHNPQLLWLGLEEIDSPSPNVEGNLVAMHLPRERCAWGDERTRHGFYLLGGSLTPTDNGQLNVMYDDERPSGNLAVSGTDIVIGQYNHRGYGFAVTPELYQWFQINSDNLIREMKEPFRRRQRRRRDLRLEFHLA